MLSQAGSLLLFAGIASSLLILPSVGRTIGASSKNLVLLSQALPFIFLTYCFVTDARSLELVFRFGGEDLPLFYRISAVWSSRSGPLLLWAAMMAIVTWFMSKNKDVVSIEVAVMHAWTAFLLVLSAMLGPFDSTVSSTSSGLNPLLQTDLMVIHPPVVFAFYSLCIATASIAMAGIISKDS